jgi:pimeloyl-ACP methyl ester carboxylesterase
MPTHEPVIGRYVTLDALGTEYRIFYEEAGEGVPMICLHTAGADSRQFRHILNDAEITRHFRVIAFDLPYHGRSNPPEKWWLKKYQLTTELYLALIRAFWQALGLDRPVVMGCSMGGSIVLKVAAEYQAELTGVIGLEGAAFAHGRDNDFLNHPAVNESEYIPSYTYGLNAPNSPEEGCRENWWYYAQGGPGVYKGDVYYYCVDMDTREDIKTIDTNRCKVSLLSGEFDYSATPEMTKAAADAIPGSRFVLMKKIGHFPMVENYPVFRPYFLAELERMRAG